MKKSRFSVFIILLLFVTTTTIVFGRIIDSIGGAVTSAEIILYPPELEGTTLEVSNGYAGLSAPILMDAQFSVDADDWQNSHIAFGSCVETFTEIYNPYPNGSGRSTICTKRTGDHIDYGVYPVTFHRPNGTSETGYIELVDSPYTSGSCRHLDFESVAFITINASCFGGTVVTHNKIYLPAVYK